MFPNGGGEKIRAWLPFLLLRKYFSSSFAKPELRNITGSENGNTPSPVDFGWYRPSHVRALSMASVLVQPLTTGYAALLVPHPGRESQACAEAPLKLGCIALGMFLRRST